MNFLSQNNVNIVLFLSLITNTSIRCLLIPASIDATERWSDAALKSCPANASSRMLLIHFYLEEKGGNREKSCRLIHTVSQSFYGRSREFNLLMITDLITKTTERKLCNWCDAIKSPERNFIWRRARLCNVCVEGVDRGGKSILFNLPANNILPINSLRPILSKSITMTSNEHSLIFSHGTLKLNESLKCGFNVHLKIGVFRFSMRLSPNWSQTLTYGSVGGEERENN